MIAKATTSEATGHGCDSPNQDSSTVDSRVDDLEWENVKSEQAGYTVVSSEEHRELKLDPVWDRALRGGKLWI